MTRDVTWTYTPKYAHVHQPDAGTQLSDAERTGELGFHKAIHGSLLGDAE